MSDAAPGHIRRLSQAELDALRRSDPGAARTYFERTLADRPTDVAALYGLALACRDLGDAKAEGFALDRVLANTPGHLPALLMKGDNCAAAGDGRAAHSFYLAAVSNGGDPAALPADIREALDRAKRYCAKFSRSYEDHLHEALANAGYDPARANPRFGRCLDLLFGKKQVFLQSPTSFYYPELPQRQFYERSEFKWLENFEAQTALIRDELLQVINKETEWRPYIQRDTNRPPRNFEGLLENPGWSALYLVHSGSIVADVAERFPATMRALANAPLCESPCRTPAVLFSLLRPGVRIPPHTGYTNVRLICHLPLIVPEGCGLRVGNEVRQWIEGEALIFDDSIEHEAWNTSESLRIVLLFDIWRPELSEEERRLIAATLAAVGSYSGNASKWS